MFSDIKFNGPTPIDSNGEELAIGDTVFTYASWSNITVPMIIIGQTKSNKYLWLTDGESIHKRMSKNVILVKYPDKIWINNK